MSTLLRLAAVLLAVATCLVPRAASSAVDNAVADDAMLRHAALALAHTTPGRLVYELRRTRGVASADVGLDRRTVTVTFADATQGAVLPSTPAHRHYSSTLFTPAARVTDDGAPTAGRALVAEPFVAQLANFGVDPSVEGPIEAADLRAAGFQVDQVYNGTVTVAFMRTLSQYSVVYMLTHSGVNKWGEAVVASGQRVDNDPAVESMVAEGTVLRVGVVGSNDLYYGVLSGWVSKYLSPFPAHALVFLNGCMLLKGSLFWQALQDKGAGALLSWENDGQAVDDSHAAGTFFGAMLQGQSVKDAVATVFAQGYGTSTSGGQTAHFGFLGDGNLTLQQVGPPATATVPPTATPTSTPLPTATLVPPALHVRYRHTVAGGRRQVVSVWYLPGAHVFFRVSFPDRTTLRASRTANSAGRATFAFRQPPGKTTTHSRVATIRIQAVAGALHAGTSIRYRITP